MEKLNVRRKKGEWKSEVRKKMGYEWREGENMKTGED